MSNNGHHSGSYYVKECIKAENHGAPIHVDERAGKGSHTKVEATRPVPNGYRPYTMIPHDKDLSKGTECAIRKWLKALGIILPIIAVVIGLVTALAQV